jgi:hypothetical protein
MLGNNNNNNNNNNNMRISNGNTMSSLQNNINKFKVKHKKRPNNRSLHDQDKSDELNNNILIHDIYSCSKNSDQSNTFVDSFSTILKLLEDKTKFQHDKIAAEEIDRLYYIYVIHTDYIITYS